MTDPKTYPKHPRSTVNRYKKRGKYDYETIHSIVNSSLVCHVSFPPTDDDPFPVILPMIGVMGNFEKPEASELDEPLDLYLHGYVSSRIMRTASQAASSVSTSSDKEGRGEGGGGGEEGGEENGLPISIAATIIDGIILSLTPNNHSYNYRSSILHGYASTLSSAAEAEAEKLYALRLLTNNIVPSRWENSRTPPDSSEMKSTQILKVSIVSASAKVRRGGVKDDRKDLVAEREGVREGIWTGVVPVWECFGEPVRGGGGLRGEVPGYLGEWVLGGNGRREGDAKEAMGEV